MIGSRWVMKFLRKLYCKVYPCVRADEETATEAVIRYRGLWRYSVLFMLLVALAPLIITSAIYHHQYQKLLRAEMIQPVSQLTANAKTTLESFVAERRSALTLVINEKSFEDLSDRGKLNRTFSNLRASFGGFLDLGLIDSQGDQRSYAGFYGLEGKNYADQDWFHEVSLRDVCVSDVYMGYRGFPHFVIAVKRAKGHDDFYVLRATVDTEVLHQRILSLELRTSSDAFIVNTKGVLQTASRFYGDVLDASPFVELPYSSRAKVKEIRDDSEGALLMGYAYIEGTPFIFVGVRRPGELMENWIALQRRMLWFQATCIVLIVIVVLVIVTWMVNRVRESDFRRVQVMHNVEYTSKMASIGRLAAGVAHEVNNPLAIINEKAGLLKDLATLSDEPVDREKIVSNTGLILKSVERCSAITHRLLGFAKRMDVTTELVNLEHLVREVMTFLEKEAHLRNIVVNFDIPDGLPLSESDPGQLQQVFLNIINNALDASSDGGRIDIAMRQESGDCVETVISDHGHGIAQENLAHIFEPFFTTKKEYGTGLGLSITYGIVEKLGGQISVKSQIGQGTSFTVTLPIKAPLIS